MSFFNSLFPNPDLAVGLDVDQLGGDIVCSDSLVATLVKVGSNRSLQQVISTNLLAKSLGGILAGEILLLLPFITNRGPEGLVGNHIHLAGVDQRHLIAFCNDGSVDVLAAAIEESANDHHRILARMLHTELADPR